MMHAPEFAIAFDVPTLEAALALDAALGEGPEYAKLGLELFTAAGPEARCARSRRAADACSSISSCTTSRTR
jgi:orotidine-5'-phosphate decarboxylase